MIEAPWDKVKDLLDAVLELSAHERSAYLDARCLDPQVRRSVDALVQSYEESGTFLQTDALKSAVAADQPWSGRMLGPYRLLDQIGAGGMGVVYRASRADDEYSQDVAVKIVSSLLFSKPLLDRFRTERQILATLNHPNIARLLDGGTTPEGLPYLVMEFIEGSPIDEYCDLRRLELRERLSLFLTVCEAVQYAHSNLIVHRDLKPGNILVASNGAPKLLDFGIAKILNATPDPASPATTFLGMLTPEYASPEQVRGEPITTPSDVYSLGVILYILLTGRPPYGLKDRSPQTILKAVCDLEPARPSSVVRNPNIAPGDARTILQEQPERLSHRLAGDLDTIVLKALQKEPGRRYPSVEQFSQDIRRHLEGLPVSARKDTFDYRAGKFVKRHAIAVVFAALLFVSLTAGILATTREARIARMQQARAEARFNDVRNLANSLLFDVHDSIQDLPGSTPARKLLVDRALRYLDSLSREASGDPSLQQELAAAYQKVGDVQGNPYYANLGDTSGALASYGKAIAIRETLLKNDPTNTPLQRASFSNYIAMAACYEGKNDLANALANARKALNISQKLVSGSHDAGDTDRAAGAYYYLANILLQAGDLTGALDGFRKAAAIRQSATAPTPAQTTSLQTHLAADYCGIARVLTQQNQLAPAIEAQQHATVLLEGLSAANPVNATIRGFLGDSYQYLGSDLKENGDSQRGLQYLHRAQAIYQTLVSADPSNVHTPYRLGYTDIAIGETLLARRDPTGGMRELGEALALFQKLVGTHPDNEMSLQGLSDAYSELGQAHEKFAAASHNSRPIQLENWNKARINYRESRQTLLKLHAANLAEAEKTKEFTSLAEKIATCDRAIAQLGKPASGFRSPP